MGIFAPFAGFRRVAPVNFGLFYPVSGEIPARRAGREIWGHMYRYVCMSSPAGSRSVTFSHTPTWHREIVHPSTRRRYRTDLAFVVLGSRACSMLAVIAVRAVRPRAARCVRPVSERGLSFIISWAETRTILEIEALCICNVSPSPAIAARQREKHARALLWLG